MSDTGSPREDGAAAADEAAADANTAEPDASSPAECADSPGDTGDIGDAIASKDGDQPDGDADAVEAGAEDQPAADAGERAESDTLLNSTCWCSGAVLIWCCDSDCSTIGW